MKGEKGVEIGLVWEGEFNDTVRFGYCWLWMEVDVPFLIMGAKH